MASKSGGFTCCVPGCFNNNKRNRNLSFYVFPQNEKLRKVWLREISRKGFKPTSGHRVCSEHFEGGKKTYMNNIPTIFPLKTHQKSKSSERRPLIRDYNASERYKSQTGATASTIAFALTTERVSLEEEIKKLQSKLDSLSLENERLQTEMNSLKFGLNRFIGSDVDMNYYTGMSARHFLAFFAFLDAGGICSRLRYWGSNNSRIQYPEVEKKGQKRLLEPRDELFLTLVRLRVNIPEKILADNYKISVAEVSRIFVTWLDLIYSRLIQLPIWASKNTTQETMPESFHQKYPSTRVIIDCTEIFIQKPSCFRAQSDTFSSYKSHNTAKGLIGIAPNGAVTFVSELYGGHCTDKAIVEDCGILQLLSEGDSVMADRGFEIQDLLARKKVYLNIPPFMRCKDQLSPEEEDETREIASVRIHVERAIERVKNYNILTQVIPNSMSEDLNKIWKVCSLLSNLKGSLVT